MVGLIYFSVYCFATALSITGVTSRSMNSPEHWLWQQQIQGGQGSVPWEIKRAAPQVSPDWFDSEDTYRTTGDTYRPSPELMAELRELYDSPEVGGNDVYSLLQEDDPWPEVEDMARSRASQEMFPVPQRRYQEIRSTGQRSEEELYHNHGQKRSDSSKSNLQLARNLMKMLEDMKSKIHTRASFLGRRASNLPSRWRNLRMPVSRRSDSNYFDEVKRFEEYLDSLSIRNRQFT